MTEDVEGETDLVGEIRAARPELLRLPWISCLKKFYGSADGLRDVAHLFFEIGILTISIELNV